MKLTLVNPWFGNEDWQRHYPPLELGFLGTYVRDNAKDVEVKIIDPIPQELDMNEVISHTKDSEIVGLTCYTERRFECFELAENIKSVNPDCNLILGGPHATFLDLSIMEHYPFVDMIVKGEGENALLEVVEGKDFKEISNITWRNKSRIITNPSRTLQHDIDEFYIDYSLLPSPERYISDYALPYKYRNLRHVYMPATRGCSYACNFCGNLNLWGRIWRAPTPKLLIERMEDIISVYNTEYFRFSDAFFTASESWTIDFLQTLKKAKLDICFGIDSGINISGRVLKELSESGCLRITFGVESGSDRILKKINKPIKRKNIIKTIMKSKELGIWTRGGFIFGWHGETKEDIKETFSVVNLLDDTELNILKVFPGTTLYEDLRAKGEIDSSYWFDKYPDNPEHFDLIAHVPHYCKEEFQSADYSIDELKTFLRKASFSHVLHMPAFIFRKYGLNGGLKLISNEFISSFVKISTSNREV